MHQPRPDVQQHRGRDRWSLHLRGSWWVRSVKVQGRKRRLEPSLRIRPKTSFNDSTPIFQFRADRLIDLDRGELEVTFSAGTSRCSCWSDVMVRVGKEV